MEANDRISIPRGEAGPGFENTKDWQQEMAEFAIRQGISREPEQQTPISQTIEQLREQGVTEPHGAIKDE